MEIQLIGVEGQPKFESVDDLLAAAPGLGLTQTGVQTDAHSRAELQGLPRFKELVGPMGGDKNTQGKVRIRYEMWEAYKLYST